MSVSVEELHMYALHISKDWKNDKERSQRAWIATTMLNPLCFINDLRYLEGDWALPVVQDKHREESHVKYVQELFLESVI